MITQIIFYRVNLNPSCTIYYANYRVLVHHVSYTLHLHHHITESGEMAGRKPANATPHFYIYIFLFLGGHINLVAFSCGHPGCIFTWLPQPNHYVATVACAYIAQWPLCD